jgi:dTDP-4-amino-4,6-dideoxygalactose transaminase
MQSIPFNKAYLTGHEIKYLEESLAGLKFSGDGPFTKKCELYLEKKYSFPKAFLTTSCTDAIELAVIACDIQPGDEVIMPSYTFVSSANPFLLRGAKIIFADSLPNHPNIDTAKLESLLSPKTKAIVPVHYAGIACDMDPILEIAHTHKLIVIEDAAQGIDAFYKKRALGSIGDFGALSFHETKNIIAGECGMLSVNRAADKIVTEIAREKGTNRSAFFRGEVDKYNWVGLGSSFLPSDLIAAFLYAQLMHLEQIQSKRIAHWNQYYNELSALEGEGLVLLPSIPEFATNNGHLFYVICKDLEQRLDLAAFLKKNGIQASFHYQALHKSPFYSGRHDGRSLPNAIRYSDCLLRLPLYYDLTPVEIKYICSCVKEYFKFA